MIKTKPQLKADVDQFIKQNGNREITGNQLNAILNDLIDSMLAGSLTAANLVISEDYTVQGQPLGSYGVGDVVTQGTQIQEVLKNYVTTANPVTYVQPSVSLSLTGSTTVEVGEDFAPVLEINWNQNDAGLLTRAQFRSATNTIQDGTDLEFTHAGQKFYDPMTITYSAIVDYDEGEQKQNNLGQDTGTPIPSGSLQTNNRTVNVRYRTRWGKNIAKPTTSIAVRSMLDMQWDNINLIEIDVIAGDTSINFTIPPGKKLVSAIFQGTLNLDQTSDFQSSEEGVDVNSADGSNPATYKTYRFAPSTPYSSPGTFVITLENE